MIGLRLRDTVNNSVPFYIALEKEQKTAKPLRQLADKGKQTTEDR